MGNFQVVYPENQLAYTVSASSQQASYPTTNVKRPERPILTWRSTGNTSETVTADLGSSQTIAGVLLLNCNAATVTVATSPDASTWTTRASSITVPTNGWNRRDQALIAFTPVSARYVRLTFATSPTTYFELGGLVVFSTIDTFDQNVSQLAFEPVAPRSDLAYVGGGGEGNSEGEPFVRVSIGKDAWKRRTGNVLGLLQRLSALHANQNVILFENDSDISSAYYARLTSKTPFQIQSYPTLSYAMVFEERV